jgi:hypothetical protein
MGAAPSREAPLSKREAFRQLDDLTLLIRHPHDPHRRAILTRRDSAFHRFCYQLEVRLRIRKRIIERYVKRGRQGNVLSEGDSPEPSDSESSSSDSESESDEENEDEMVDGARPATEMGMMDPGRAMFRTELAQDAARREQAALLKRQGFTRPQIRRKMREAAAAVAPPTTPAMEDGLMRRGAGGGSPPAARAGAHQDTAVVVLPGAKSVPLAPPHGAGAGAEDGATDSGHDDLARIIGPLAPTGQPLEWALIKDPRMYEFYSLAQTTQGELGILCMGLTSTASFTGDDDADAAIMAWATQHYAKNMAYLHSVSIFLTQVAPVIEHHAATGDADALALARLHRTLQHEKGLLLDPRK